jgi:hypothetical protein
VINVPVEHDEHTVLWKISNKYIPICLQNFFRFIFKGVVFFCVTIGERFFNTDHLSTNPHKESVT